MKKIIFLGIVCCMILSSFKANANQVTVYNEVNDTIYFQVLEVNSRTMEVLLYATSTVDEFCKVLSRKEVSVPIGLMCAFAGAGNPVCYVYGAVMAACAINGAVKLAIEGDFTNVILESVSAGTKVYKMSKVNTSTYKIE